MLAGHRCAGPGRSCGSATATTPRFAVIAYGKLGGKELGYGSDLDIVFLYDDRRATATRAGGLRRASCAALITWLTQPHRGRRCCSRPTLRLRPERRLRAAGDARSRPSSASTSCGSNAAWTWEHQALTRARFCRRRRRRWARASRRCAREVLRQRARPRRAARRGARDAREDARRAPGDEPSRFDVKHDAGGMIDVEFVVQYLVLAHAARASASCTGNARQHRPAAHRRRTRPASPAELAERRARCLPRIPPRCSTALRLNHAASRVDPDSVAAQRDAVRQLWALVFGEA
ncbi:MAG: hypothetical protein MZW92_15290 [Comamonadaceae bacterium]|nr:hypothetical protein [Comamonadaceae bacterium]